MDDRARWRAPELGTPREVQTAAGPLRVFESGEGPPVVFVHGFLVNANLWRKVAPEVARSARAFVLDLPFGAHERAVAETVDLSPPAMAGVVADALEALDLEGATLVGNDTGGAVCQMLATTRPERVGRLVLTSCDYREHFPPRVFAYFDLLARFPALIPLLFAPLRLRAPRRLPIAFGWLTNRPIDRAAEDSYVLPGLTDGGVRRDVVKVLKGVDTADSQRAADRLPEFGKPALVAWSADDRVFPAEDARRLAGELGARLEWIENARTFSPEDQPARLARLIADFVREPAATPGAAG